MWFPRAQLAQSSFTKSYRSHRQLLSQGQSKTLQLRLIANLLGCSAIFSLCVPYSAGLRSCSFWLCLLPVETDTEDFFASASWFAFSKQSCSFSNLPGAQAIDPTETSFSGDSSLGKRMILYNVYLGRTEI